MIMGIRIALQVAPLRVHMADFDHL